MASDNERAALVHLISMSEMEMAWLRERLDDLDHDLEPHDEVAERKVTWEDIQTCRTTGTVTRDACMDGKLADDPSCYALGDIAQAACLKAILEEKET